MFLICDVGPGRKGSGKLNPNKQTKNQAAMRPLRNLCRLGGAELG